MNLDDLLDGVDLNKLPSTGNVTSSGKNKSNKAAKNGNSGKANKSNDLDAILDEAITSNNLDKKEELKIRLVSEEIKPWLASSANVPKDFREKWTKMAKVDTEAEIVSKFQLSYAYRCWDGPIPMKNGINRSLQEVVRKAANASGLDENKTSRLLTLVNPVADSEHGKALQLAFAKLILADYANDIKKDPNYSSEQFPALATVIN